MEPIRYSEVDIDVRLGDLVTYKSMFFWRGWKPGRVSYLPGQSPVRAAMERDGSKWIGVTGEGGTYRGFLVDPTTLRVQGAIKFDRRQPGSEPHTTPATGLDQLRGHLAVLIAILDEEGDAHWANWMRASDEMLADGDLSGVEHFLGAFGGMGSFNDLASERSSAVAARAYALARRIQGGL